MQTFSEKAMSIVSQLRPTEFGPELLRGALIGLTRTLVGAQARYLGPCPGATQTIFYANHSSNLDALAIWSALPANVRRATRAVRRARLLGQVKTAPPLRPRRAACGAGRSQARTGGPGSARATAPGTARGRFPDHFSGRNARQFSDAGTVQVRSLLAWPASFLKSTLCRSTCLRCIAACRKARRCRIRSIATCVFGSPLARNPDEDKATFLDRARRELIRLEPQIVA